MKSCHGKIFSGVLALLFLGAATCNASASQVDGQNVDHASMAGMDMKDSKSSTMSSSIDIADPMNREGSGTSWLPDSSPVYAHMIMTDSGMLMLHGDIFPRYTQIGGDRDVSVAGEGGRSRFDAPSMLMGMYSRPVGEHGQLGLRLMMSADPFIEKGYGYPLLYQTGESYHGQPIHDRQHPHDFVSELSATYSHNFGDSSAYIYVGYPGEPALGPPAFMHRVSAMDNPDAPISHHWQDATHITYGVTTLGYSLGTVKFEASAFKGEEPDSNRYNFDTPRLDSYSGRISWNPTTDLALQVSRGMLRKPEPGDPLLKKRYRNTASAIYNRALGDDSNWSNALVWGQNDDGSEGRSNGYLFETSYQRAANTFYARYEQVQKPGHELVLAPPNDDRVFDVSSLALGYVHDLRHGQDIDVGVGGQVTFDTNPSSLDNVYGGRSHRGYQVFLRIRPSHLTISGGM